MWPFNQWMNKQKVEHTYVPLVENEMIAAALTLKEALTAAMQVVSVASVSVFAFFKSSYNAL